MIKVSEVEMDLQPNEIKAVMISREEFKTILYTKITNDGAIDNSFSALCDKLAKQFGYLDWLQAFHLM